MAEPFEQESPLAELRAVVPQPAEADLWLSERPPMGHINLRGDPADQDFVGLVRKTTNIHLPEAPNRSLSNDGIAVLWLAPYEWLVLSPRTSEAAVQASLRTTLAKRSHAVTDVAGGNCILRLAGVRTRDVLAKGCSIDFHERTFGPDVCVQAQVAKANVLIWRRDASPAFELIVRRSFAEYLALWLLDAGREYGLGLRH